MHPEYTFPTYFPNIHSNIILPSTPRSSACSLPFRFSNQNTVHTSYLSYACTCPAHLILLDLITLIMFDEAYKLCILFKPPR
jgi:hypothetical protein